MRMNDERSFQIHIGIPRICHGLIIDSEQIDHDLMITLRQTVCDFSRAHFLAGLLKTVRVRLM